MTLLSKALRVIRRDFVKKCLEISAETAEKIDDYIEFYEQSGKCLKRENHEQSSLKKYVDRMKEGHNDIFFRLREYRRRVLVPASVGEKEHDAAHVRDDQRAHHARGDPGRIVSVRSKTHNGHRDKLLCTFHLERMMQCMSEMFNVPAMLVATQADLYWCASRRTTGIVMDSLIPSNRGGARRESTTNPVHLRCSACDPGPSTLFECTELSWEA